MPHLVEHDPLTGLPSRLLFQDRLGQAMAHGHRRDDLLALMLIDLDQLKEINDAQGDDVGDRVLQEVAQRLRAQLRGSDTVARIDGDAFALILRDLPDADAASLIAGKILAALDAPFRIDAHSLHPRASLGIALFPADGDTPDQLLHSANLALYRAKAAGVRMRLFAGTIKRAFDHGHELARDLSQAIERGELTLEYQPQIDLEEQRVVGFEALLRWHHPTLGQIAPETFVELAESSGQIGTIGKWALAQACASAASWPDRLGPLRLAVNFSTAQMARDDLAQVVARVLEQSGLPAERLELELTERSVLDGADRVQAVLMRLHAVGVRLALDDFGTGYASLSHLGCFPLDALKIDRSFVAGTLGLPSHAIVQCLVELGHRLGLRVTAEGIETTAQLETLRRLGCDEGQGHVLGKPLAAGEVVPWLIARAKSQP